MVLQLPVHVIMLQYNRSCDPIADKNEELKKKVKFLNDQMLVRVTRGETVV